MDEASALHGIPTGPGAGTRPFFSIRCLFATPPISQACEPLVRQSLERGPESLIPESPRLPSVCIPVGSTTKRQADRTKEEEGRAYLDVGLGLGAWDLVPGDCVPVVGSDDADVQTTSQPADWSSSCHSPELEGRQGGDGRKDGKTAGEGRSNVPRLPGPVFPGVLG